jgi:hypothetical protein
VAFQDGLKQAHADLDPLAALRSPIDVLLGVGTGATSALADLGLHTVLDLATAPLFGIAADAAAAADTAAPSLYSALGSVPGGVVVDPGPPDLPTLVRSGLTVLRAL